MTVSPFARTCLSNVIFRMVGSSSPRVWSPSAPRRPRFTEHTMPTVPKSLFVLGLCALIAFSIASLAAPSPARADGAFPDSLQVLLPAGQPHRIILATNFGLIISEDD